MVADLPLHATRSLNLYESRVIKGRILLIYQVILLFQLALYDGKELNNTRKGKKIRHHLLHKITFGSEVKSLFRIKTDSFTDLKLVN